MQHSNWQQVAAQKRLPCAAPAPLASSRFHPSSVFWPRVIAGVYHQWHEDIGGFSDLRAGEPRACNPHHGHFNVVDKQTLVENAEIASKVPCPVRVAQHHHRMPAGTRSSSRLNTRPIAGGNAERFKIIPRDEWARAMLRLPAAGNARRKGILAQHVANGGAVFSQCLVHRIREGLCLVTVV